MRGVCASGGTHSEGAGGMVDDAGTVKALRVLHVADSAKDSGLLKERLSALGGPLEVHLVSDREGIASSMRESGHDLIIAECRAAGLDAVGILALKAENCPGAPLIFVGEEIGEEEAVELVKRGAADFVSSKGYGKLPLAAGRALEESEARKRREAAEAAMSLKMALLEAQMNSTIDGILVVDPQGKKIIQNKRTVQLWKIPQEVVEDPDGMKQVQHIMGITKNPERFMEEIQYQMSHPMEVTRDELELRDGTILDRYSAPVVGEKGEHFGRIYTFYDITDRKRALEDLAEEKERLAVTLRSIGDGVITTDTRGNVVILNKAAEALTGWGQEEAAGRPLEEVFNIINEKTRERCPNPAEKVLALGEVVEIANHTVLISRDGTERVLADSGAPIRDGSGKIMGVVLVFRDVTEKQALLERAQRAEKLESIGVLAGGLAHDFNNLLGGVFGYIEMARQTCGPEGRTAEFLDKALKPFARAKTLTQRLLTFAKGGVPVRRTGRLGPVVRDGALFALSGSNVASFFDLDEELWPCDFDENQIAQVVENIVLNAIQAMPSGGTLRIGAQNVEPKANASGPLEVPHIHLSFADTGVGIASGDLRRIFDPFFTTKGKGSGLGLATAFSIVKRHEGEITVDSEPGKGSVFHVWLPASSGARGSGQDRSPENQKGAGTILVMDDEDFIREIVSEGLRNLGYEVIEAKNGTEALARCAERRKAGSALSCAFFDLTVPGGMGGKETIAELRKVDSSLPVFAMSGFSEDPVMASPKEYGFVDSIRKPFNRLEIEGLLEKMRRKEA
jgi:PAS domain S-box-containing protein